MTDHNFSPDFIRGMEPVQMYWDKIMHIFLRKERKHETRI